MVKCCLLELEREITYEQYNLICKRLGRRKKEKKGPNANASLVMQDYPLFLVSVHLTLYCIGDICPNLQHPVFLESRELPVHDKILLVKRHVHKLG